MASMVLRTLDPYMVTDKCEDNTGSRLASVSLEVAVVNDGGSVDVGEVGGVECAVPDGDAVQRRRSRAGSDGRNRFTERIYASVEDVDVLKYRGRLIDGDRSLIYGGRSLDHSMYLRRNLVRLPMELKMCILCHVVAEIMAHGSNNYSKDATTSWWISIMWNKYMVNKTQCKCGGFDVGRIKSELNYS